MLQNRVRNEVTNALKENGMKFNTKLLQGLPYLERCIKESLRIYPSVFLISRVPNEDIKLRMLIKILIYFLLYTLLNTLHRISKYS